jgi:hypothetical protein
MTTSTFSFRFSPSYRQLARLFGVRPSNAEVGVDGLLFQVRFGPWRVTTEIDNIERVETTGPFHFVKTAGPARLSFADRGLTFATNGDEGVCITFRRPIVGGEPTGRLRHPNLTLTVADTDGLIHAITARSEAGVGDPGARTVAPVGR